MNTTEIISVQDQFQAARAKAIEVCESMLAALRDEATDLAAVDELGHVFREEIWSSRALQRAVRKAARAKIKQGEASAEAKQLPCDLLAAIQNDGRAPA